MVDGLFIINRGEAALVDGDNIAVQLFLRSHFFSTRSLKRYKKLLSGVKVKANTFVEACFLKHGASHRVCRLLLPEDQCRKGVV